ncbi:MAG: response regulator [Leptospirales bacterium]|nr:response regulator [Leptospirales bacterium]
MKQRTSVGTVKSRGKVLAVDDSETMRMMVRQTLEYGGYQATVAPDGAQALQIFDQDNFDLVITDINMPGMDGLTLVRELRKRNQDVPILTLTTESEEALKRQGAEAGANGWIVKPLIPAQLLDLLGQILDRN